MRAYSIKSKRATTIAHAFASALAPVDKYDKASVNAALGALGLDPDKLNCVYCGATAETWDHLVNLVKDGQLNGYGHQLGNLVPCCRHCNSKKGSKCYRTFIDSLTTLTATQKDLLRSKLGAHLTLSKPISLEDLSGRSADLLKSIKAIQEEIVGLMGDADKKVQELRRESDSAAGAN